MFGLELVSNYHYSCAGVVILARQTTARLRLGCTGTANLCAAKRMLTKETHLIKFRSFSDDSDEISDTLRQCTFAHLT